MMLLRRSPWSLRRWRSAKPRQHLRPSNRCPPRLTPALRPLPGLRQGPSRQRRYAAEQRESESKTPVTPGPQRVASPAAADQPSNGPSIESAPTAPAAVGESGLAGAWTATVKALARHKGKKYFLGALLKDCRPDAIYLDGDDTLCLAFAHRSNMERMQEEMDDPSGRRLVSEVISQHFGRNYEFKLTLVEGNSESGGSSRPAQNSPLVRAAMGMGARILEEVEE